MALKGTKQSPEHIRKRMEGSKNGRFKKGQKPWNTGLNYSGFSGKKHTKENKLIWSANRTGKPVHTIESKKILSVLRKERIGSKSSNWKGGRRKKHDGYITIINPTHPRQSNGYVFEHHLIVEAKIGRYLKPEEVVHHINGIKEDNRIENLTLFKNNGEHIKFHIKLKKFPYYTEPMTRQILEGQKEFKL